MANLKAIEFEDAETGRRFWKVCKADDVDLTIEVYCDELGYFLSDVDDANPDYSGPIYDPTWTFFQ